MSTIDLSEAVEAAAKAIREWQYVRDAGDGHPAIRVGTPEQAATLALDAALPVIERAVRADERARIARENRLIESENRQIVLGGSHERR